MDSYIKTGPGGTTFAGPDAVRLVQATTLRSAIKLAKAGIHATRGASLTRCLAMASTYTGKKYKRTEAGLAMADLKTWCDTMSAALPRRAGSTG